MVPGVDRGLRRWWRWLPALALPPAAVGAGPPPNDDCEASATIVCFGCVPFDTTVATTDGPPHAACLVGGDDQIHADVWIHWRPSFGGPASVSTCTPPPACVFPTFNTRLAVYAGWACPVDDARLLGCNDDVPGCPGFGSFLTVTVAEGAEYLIRIGGYNGAAGTGAVLIEPVSGDPGECDVGVCPADITGAGDVPDGVVGVEDLVALLLQWGGQGTADITGPGGSPDGVVDVQDLTAMLLAWGECRVGSD